jgi:hypothetical protein
MLSRIVLHVFTIEHHRRNYIHPVAFKKRRHGNIDRPDNITTRSILRSSPSPKQDILAYRSDRPNRISRQSHTLLLRWEFVQNSTIKYIGEVMTQGTATGNGHRIANHGIPSLSAPVHPASCIA